MAQINGHGGSQWSVGSETLWAPVTGRLALLGILMLVTGVWACGGDGEDTKAKMEPALSTDKGPVDALLDKYDFEGARKAAVQLSDEHKYGETSPRTDARTKIIREEARFWAKRGDYARAFGVASEMTGHSDIRDVTLDVFRLAVDGNLTGGKA